MSVSINFLINFAYYLKSFPQESGRTVRTLTSIVQQIFQGIVKLKHETRTLPCGGHTLETASHLPCGGHTPETASHFLSLSSLFPFIHFLFCNWTRKRFCIRKLLSKFTLCLWNNEFNFFRFAATKKIFRVICVSRRGKTTMSEVASLLTQKWSFMIICVSLFELFLKGNLSGQYSDMIVASIIS